MKRKICCLFLISLCLAVSLASPKEKRAIKSGGKASTPKYVPAADNGNPLQASRAAKESWTANEKTETKKSGHGFSAAGIVVLIVVIILAATAIYHFFIFYPILCKKERNYDMIEIEKV